MSQPEARLQVRMIKALRAHPAISYAERIRPTGLAGWPDLYAILRNSGRAVHIEVKMPGEQPTRLQRAVLEDLARAGAVTGVAHSVAECLAVVGSVVA